MAVEPALMKSIYDQKLSHSLTSAALHSRDIGFDLFSAAMEPARADRERNLRQAQRRALRLAEAIDMAIDALSAKEDPHVG